MQLQKLKDYQAELDGKSPVEIISWAIENFGTGNMALASSMSAEDQLLTDMLLKIAPSFTVFTLDTGRLPQETFAVIAETARKYCVKVEIVFPEASQVEAMVNDSGPNLFFDSHEKRKRCCLVRKIVPLGRKLASLKVNAWICGLRSEQSPTRAAVQAVEWDSTFNLFKINPLANWTERQVWDYIHDHNVPYNKLHDAGYPSIGCACCTRAVALGEDVRSGRWWWEQPEHKECGLHLSD